MIAAGTELRTSDLGQTPLLRVVDDGSALEVEISGPTPMATISLRRAQEAAGTTRTYGKPAVRQRDRAFGKLQALRDDGDFGRPDAHWTFTLLVLIISSQRTRPVSTAPK